MWHEERVQTDDGNAPLEGLKRMAEQDAVKVIANIAGNDPWTLFMRVTTADISDSSLDTCPDTDLMQTWWKQEGCHFCDIVADRPVCSDYRRKPDLNHPTEYNTLKILLNVQRRFECLAPSIERPSWEVQTAGSKTIRDIRLEL